MRRQRLWLVPVLLALALLAASCATQDAETGPDAATAPEPVPEPVEAEASEPETDAASEEGEASEPEAEPAPAEAEVEAAPSSTTSSIPEATSTTTSTLPADCDFSDHAEDVLAAVYQVVTSDGIGTAFYLGNGEWLTAAHVVGTANRVSLHNGRDSLSVAVKGIDHSVDLALLEGTPISVSREVPTLTIMEGEPTQPGEAAIAVGYPLYREDSASISQGVVSRYEEDEVGELLVTDASVNPGNSGGPMLNKCGEVIGVVRQKYVGFDVEGLGYAISVNDIASTLPRLRAGIKTSPPDDTSADDYSDPTATVPPTPAHWTVTETEPDLMTGEIFPYAFITAADYERDHDLYDPPELYIGCAAVWGIWWGGDYVAASYGSGIPAEYRIGGSEITATEWDESTDNETMLLGLDAASDLLDRMFQASPSAELVVRAWNYDDSVIGTAVFSLQGMSDALSELESRCTPSPWIPYSEEWGDSVVTFGLDGQLDIRFQCTDLLTAGFDALLFAAIALEDEGRGFWMRYGFGDEGAPPPMLATLDPSESGTALFVSLSQTLDFQAALDADTSGALRIDVVTSLSATAEPVASDTFNVSGWLEAKTELEAACP